MFSRYLTTNLIIRGRTSITIRYLKQHAPSTFRSEFSASDLQLPVAKYGGRQTVTLLPGVGIGPEMMRHVQQIFAVANVPIDFEEFLLDSHENVQGNDMDEAIVAIERNGVALKGNIESKFVDPTAQSRNVILRRRLDLFANILHCTNIANVPTRHTNVDIVLIRENTEGEYSGLEHETVPGVVESLKIVTRTNIERISRFAFDYAIKHGRKKVTAVHKANIQKLGDGLFLKVCQAMAASEYSQLQFESMIVDNASMQLVRNPAQFDVMLMPNLYGNIISNIACGLVGGAGLVSGRNIGDHYAVFETGTRNMGSALTDRNVANPTAMIRASVDLLRYLRLDSYADLIESAVLYTLSDRRIHTADLNGGKHSTSDFVESVVDLIANKTHHH